MRLEWDKDGERLYETGTDRGVVYPYDYDERRYAEGYAWNGLTGVDENPSGAEATDLYANNSAYIRGRSKEEFGGTINAYMYPEEFELLDGTARYNENGIKISRQKRRKFGFSYRTLLGADDVGNEYGYKIHLIYNAIASPSTKSYETVNNDPNAITFSWELTTTPLMVDGYRTSAHVEIDSTKIDPDKLAVLEDLLYGTENTSPRFPTIEDLQYLYPEAVLTGNPLIFSDGADAPVVDLSVALEPTQELNGFDTPWPGGFGKNKLKNVGVSKTENGVTFTKNADGSVLINGTATSATYFNLDPDFDSTAYAGYLVTGLPEAGSTATFAFQISASVSDHTSKQRLTSDVPANNVVADNGTGLAFEIRVAGGTYNNVLIKPMMVAPTETDFTYEPYENYSPISGYTGVNVTRTGKNRFPIMIEDGATGGITFTKVYDDDGYVSGIQYSGTRAAESSNLHKILGVTYLEAGTYRVSGGFGTAAVGGLLNVRHSGSMTQVGPAPVAQDTGSGATWTVAEADWYQITLGVNAGVTVDAEVHPMICLSSEDQTFESCKEKNYIAAWQSEAGTVYGGTIDFTTGKLTATTVCHTLDGTESFAVPASATDRIAQLIIRFGWEENDPSDDARVLSSSSHFMYATPPVGNTYGYFRISEIHQLIFGRTGSPWETAQDFKDFLAAENAAGTPVQICYKLATPIVTWLSPTEIRTLLGQNHIYSDSGEITLTYRKAVSE